MDLKLPNLGEGADSGTVVNLFVKEGDSIVKDQPILELENEKAVATIPSTGAGVIAKIYVKTGDKLSVGQKILSIGDGASTPATPSDRGETAQKIARAPEPEEESKEHKQTPEPEDTERPATPGIPPAASPSLRRAAREFGVDLTRVRGSARGGRILLEDVRSYIQKLQRLASQPKTPAATAAAAPAARPQAESIDFSKWGPISKKALSPLRQVIARRMWENWNAIPHVTQFDDVDITALNELRKKHAPAYAKAGTHLTLTAFTLKAVVDTLKKHPIFNSSLDENSHEIIYKEYFHIGVAVDTDAGLIVPVLRDVDKKSVLDLSKELEALARKARERKVGAEDLKGGTFTISNQGGIGGGHFTPIVNKPEVAILGLGRGKLQPVVRNGAIESRLLMPIGLSYDHRVIDGGVAARFIVDLVGAFETFPESAVKLP